MDQLQCLQILRSGHHLQLDYDPRLLPGPSLPPLPHAHLYQLAPVGKGVARPRAPRPSQDAHWGVHPMASFWSAHPTSCTVLSCSSPEFPTVWCTALPDVSLLSKTHLPATRGLCLSPLCLFSQVTDSGLCVCVGRRKVMKVMGICTIMSIEDKMCQLKWTGRV